MKKFAVLLVLVLVSACSKSGYDFNFMPWRQEFIETWNAYDIEFFEQGPRYLKTETIVERNYPKNELLTAFKGYVAADEKTYKKDYYATEKLRVNEDGYLSTGSVPEKFKKGEQKAVLGVSKVDGEELFLVPSDIDTFVVLVKDDGSFYGKMGQIRYNKLIVLDADFHPYPQTLKLLPIATTNAEQTEPVTGFEIKYSGLKDGQAVLTYYDYTPGNTGKYEDFKFSTQSETIGEVKGVKFKIMGATDEKLDYMVVE